MSTPEPASRGHSEASARHSGPNTTPPPLAALPHMRADHDRETHHHDIGKDAAATSSSAPASGTAGASVNVPAPERCRRARSLASQWMSALMENPPTSAQMASFREQHAPAHASDNAATTTTAEPTAPTTSSSHNSSSAKAAASFAQAVRRGQLASGHGEPKAATPPLAPMPPPLPATAALTGAARPPTAASASPSHVDPTLTAENTALMPVDADTVAPLLRALREVALSSSSLDTMRKLSSLPASGEAGSAAGGAGGGSSKRHHGTSHSTPRQSPPPSPSTSPASASASASAPTAVVDPLVESVIMGQWLTVQTHLLKVEQLVQNRSELSAVLAALLGSDWRCTTPPTPPSSPAVPVALLAESALKSSAETAALVGAAPAPVAGGATGSGLNLHARPFQSRTFTLGSAAAAAATSPVVPPAPADEVSAVTTAEFVGSTSSSHKDSRSFLKLSESSTAYYSPSAHVASFIERNSPTPATNGSLASEHAASLTSLRSTPVGSHDGGASARRHSRLGDEDDEERLPHLTHTGLARTPSSASSTSSRASHRGLSDGLTVPVTPNAIGTLASAQFPSYPPPPRAFPSDGYTGASAFTATSTTNGYSTHHPGLAYSSMPPPMGSASSPTATGSQAHHSGGSSTSLTFHLESREDMLRRRQAAPTAFYSSASRPNATSSPASYSGGGAVYSPGSLRPHHVGNTPMSVPVSPLVSMGNTPVMAPQCPYDYILVLDFEATCEEYPPAGYLYEIIEFPVVLVDVRAQRSVAEFHRFVKPKYKPVLSTFCKNLTGTLQHEIDGAAPLEEVIRQFERWLHQTVPPTARVVFATDGPMDFREFMLHHSVQRQGIRFPTLFYQFIDVKQVFATFLHCQPGKIKAMLEVLNIPFEGRLHSGLDDARNIARIVIGLLQWGSNLCEAPLNRLPLNTTGPAASPTSSASGMLYLPPSTVETSTHCTPAPSHQVNQRGAHGFNSSSSWLASARDATYSIDGTFYA